MTSEEQKELKRKVLQLIGKSEHYNKYLELKVMIDEAGGIFILYGTNVLSGVAGFGNTIDSALLDFRDNWNFYTRKKEKSLRHD